MLWLATALKSQESMKLLQLLVLNYVINLVTLSKVAIKIEEKEREIISGL